MNCPKCGKQLNEGVKFCNGCGTAIAAPEQNVQPVQNAQQPVQQPIQAKKAGSNTGSNIIVTCLLFMLGMLLKPAKAFKAKIKELEEPKNGFIFIGLVSAVSMVVRVVFTFLFALIDRPCVTFLGKKTCTTIDESLKAINWVDITIKHLITVIVIGLAVAGIYYLASLVAKKTTKFMRLAVISTAALIPFMVTAFILTPIFSWLFGLMKLSGEIVMFIDVIGLVYSLTIFYTLMKEEVNFDDKDISIYFYSLITVIIVIIAYFVLKNMLVNQVSDALGSSLGSSGLGSIIK